MRLLGVFSTDRMLGGAEVSFTLTLSGLQASGVDVLAAIPGEGPLGENLRKHSIAYAIAPQETFRRGGAVQFLLKPHPAWMEIVRKHRPDILHCNAVRSALYGQAVGRAASVPVIFHARTSNPDAPFDQFLMATTSRIICTSKAVYDRFPAWMGKHRLVVIPNAFDPAGLQAPPAQFRRLTSARIGVVGRLSPEKGQHLMIEAAPAILRLEPAARIIFYGGEDPSCGGYQKQLEEMARRLNCEHAIEFAGYRSDMRSIYGNLDIVVFPSQSEGFGRVIIEAGAAGKPVIASRLPVFMEILPVSLHRIATASTSEEFADQVTEVIRNDSLRSRIVKELHEHVRIQFNLDRHVTALRQVYSSL